MKATRRLSMSSVLLARRRDIAQAIFDEVAYSVSVGTARMSQSSTLGVFFFAYLKIRVLEAMQRHLREWRGTTAQEMLSLKGQLDDSVTVGANLVSERMSIAAEVGHCLAIGV